VVVGGLVVSTVFTLILVPIILSFMITETDQQDRKLDDPQLKEAA